MTTTFARRHFLVALAALGCAAPGRAYGQKPPRPTVSYGCTRFELKYNDETGKWACIGPLNRRQRDVDQRSRQLRQDTRRRRQELQRKAQRQLQEIRRLQDEFRRDAQERTRRLIQDAEQRYRELLRQQQVIKE